MPRIIVLADGRYGQAEDYEQVVFDEAVTCALLHDDHAAAQIIERMAWALADVERGHRTAAHPVGDAWRESVAAPQVV